MLASVAASCTYVSAINASKCTSVFVVYRRKTLTGSPDPMHANGTDKPCRRPNPNHIFELFRQLSGHSASNVRFLLLSDIAADVQFYQRTSFVCLEMRNTLFNQWITNLSLEEMYADKLTLFSLSWLYKQHTVVITKNKLWSTLHSNSPVNEEALLDVCSVKLVYLGQLQFGTLRPKMTVTDFVMVPVAA